jgi:hypothetical protein
MKISFDSKGDFHNIQSWLDNATKHNLSKSLKPISDEGTASLKNNTPKDTGETSLGWVSEVVTNGDVTEIVWKNNAHPESDVNVAKLIELGHGTGTGGYVPPNPYIKNAMKPVWNDVDRVVKELIK